MGFAAMNVTTTDLEKHLRRCGYDDRRLRKGYQYSAGCVALAGFAYQTYDARDACIGADNFTGGPSADSSKLVATHRELGAPVFFVCREEGLEWWSQRRLGPVLERKIIPDKVGEVFREYEERLSPESIYRAKTIGRIDVDHQLRFVDVGLMPILEEKMGEELARLFVRTLGTLRARLERQASGAILRGLFKAVFWLLAAKILKDKNVPQFKNLDFEKIDAVLELVAKHYGAEQPLPQAVAAEREALEAAADVVRNVSSLENLTVESLAYVYENTLIDEETRKALGIHATPSYLVDYIVWQLAGWIEEIPEEERFVLEPTCGHAPFLVSAARLLRELRVDQDPKKRHAYLRDHLTGIETDALAREIARLSLTLADVPNPNGWRLIGADVFDRDILSRAARNATIVLGNPPFEDFSPAKREQYGGRGVVLQYKNTASEVLSRILPYLRVGSVFGLVLPRAFLHSSNSSSIRKRLAAEYELRTICTLPENVFSFGRLKSVVVLGRKARDSQSKSIPKNWVDFIRIEKEGLSVFQERYEGPSEKIAQVRFTTTAEYDFRLAILREVWEYCSSFPCLKSGATVAKGFEYKDEESLRGRPTIAEQPFPGAVRGYARFQKGIHLVQTPPETWLNVDPTVIRRPGLGTIIGKPQVLLNYIRVSGGPWRLKALMDCAGHAVTSAYLVVRPSKAGWSLCTFWALLNSPLANAYTYSHSMERHNLAKVVRRVPVPPCDESALHRLNNLVNQYFDLFSASEDLFTTGIGVDDAKRCMLAIDAEVMRLYDLPPKLERQVLDLFNGSRRPGVDFELSGYFPRDFRAYIPLHEYLSEDFQRSTIGFVRQWVDEMRSPQLIRALEVATEDSTEERDADLSS